MNAVMLFFILFAIAGVGNEISKTRQEMIIHNSNIIEMAKCQP